MKVDLHTGDILQIDTLNLRPEINVRSRRRLNRVHGRRQDSHDARHSGLSCC
jgi:hypothetical protein